MQPDWLKEILEIINRYKDNVPEGHILLENTDSMNINQLLSALNGVFDLEENAIKKEYEKSFVTDTYEKNVRHFATQLIMSMVSHHKQLEEYEDYKKLLGQRHVAYGFYVIIEYRFEYGKTILEDSSFEKPLYLGLVAFYQDFYGSFSDNEEAIKLLCKYYPKKIGLDGDVDKIANVVYRHISNAGTPSDFGYAYKGIELIRRYIGNLPIGIIDKLLREYELFRIINEKVYRHQIFTIIENSIMTDEEKQNYKFSYLDSILLADFMNDKLYNKYGQQDNTSRYYNSLRTSLMNHKIGLIENDTTESTYAYWTNNDLANRQFIVDEEAVINLSLNIGEKQILLKYTDRPDIKIECEFVYEDWRLDGIISKEFKQKLDVFLESEIGIVYNNLTFSLLYLNNYRGINEQLVDFNHQFTYDKAKNKLMYSTVSPVIPHFYGKKIHSLSCIVGKNGTGKTSTVDFLRGTFFRLLRLIGEYDVTCENGYVSKSDYKDYDILDEDCEFFVVFHLDDEPYYLANIKIENDTIVKSFNRNTYKNINKLSKIVYFSNKLSVNQDELYIDEGITLKDKNKKIAKSLNNFRQVDYSEASSFLQKQKVIEVEREKRKEIVDAKHEGTSAKDVNKDLCYQLAFLGYLTSEKLRDYFDMPSDKIFTLKSASLNSEGIQLTVEHSLKEIIDENYKKLKSFLTAHDVKLECFSSGQYAKFSFLSKLYWFLEGYDKNHKDFESVFENNVNIFSNDEALIEGESALIFIDEGELYYHPEWQRGYIKTLVDNIQGAKTEAIIQVVVTTNSPFIISDILSEDITYLSKEEKEFDCTFGQNIHKLLKDNFFMSYTIGAYSQEVIEKIMKWLLSNKKDEINSDEENKVSIGEELGRYFGEPIESKDYYEKISCLIGKIGEPIYREKLLDMLSKSELDKTSEMEILLRKKAEIEREIEALQKDQVKS